MPGSSLIVDCSVCGAALEQAFAVDRYPLITSPCAPQTETPLLPLVVGTCAVCSHVQLMERPTKEQLDQIYLGEYTSVIGKGTFAKADAMALDCKSFLDSALAAPLDKGSAILEIGCFDGAFLSLFGEGYELLASEPNPMGKVAAERYGVKVRPEYFRAGDYRDSTIDLLVMRHLIEHIAEPSLILQDCRAALKPGGRLLIETPRVEHTLENKVIGNFYHQHLHYFSHDSLKILLEKAGFAIVAHDHKDFRQFVIAIPAGRGAEPKQRLCSASRLEAYKAYLDGLRTDIRNWLEGTSEPFVIYGASSTATGIIHLGGLPLERLCYLIDGDPRKENMVLPGAGAVVHAPEYLLKHPVGTVFVASDFFKDEIIDSIRRRFPGVVHQCIVSFPVFQVIDMDESQEPVCS